MQEKETNTANRMRISSFRVTASVVKRFKNLAPLEARKAYLH